MCQLFEWRAVCAKRGASRLQQARGSRCLGLDLQRANRSLTLLDLEVTDPHHCSPRVLLATLATQLPTRLFYIAEKERTLEEPRIDDSSPQRGSAGPQFASGDEIRR
jgi:hypothetical protein